MQAPHSGALHFARAGPMTLGWVQQHHLGRLGSPRVRGRGCCDSSLDMGLENMGHVGEAVGQLLVVDGIHSGWLG